MSATLTNLNYHIVFSTKMRLKLITPELTEELYPYIGGIINGEKGHLLAIGGIYDHIHILARFHQTYAVADIVKKIKGHSSKFIHNNKNIPFEWQRGYGAFSVSESLLPQIIKYINNQEEHHKERSFQDELLIFLKKNNIIFDEKYLWD